MLCMHGDVRQKRLLHRQILHRNYGEVHESRMTCREEDDCLRSCTITSTYIKHTHHITIIMNNQRRSKPTSFMATIAADLDAALAPIIKQPLRYCCCHPLDYDISDDTFEELSYYYKSRRGDYRYAATQARHKMNGGAARYPHKPSKKKEDVNISRHQSASSCSTLQTRNAVKQQQQHDQYQGSNLLYNNDNDADENMEEPPDITRYPILGSSMIPIPRKYASSVSTSDTSSTRSLSSSSQGVSSSIDEASDL